MLLRSTTLASLLALEGAEHQLRVGGTRNIGQVSVPAAALEAALDESFSALRRTLRIAGAAVLQARGNLPVDPLSDRQLDEGKFHDQPRSFVERLIELRSGPFGYMNVEALVDLARHMRAPRLLRGSTRTCN